MMCSSVALSEFVTLSVTFQRFSEKQALGDLDSDSAPQQHLVIMVRRSVSLRRARGPLVAIRRPQDCARAALEAVLWVAKVPDPVIPHLRSEDLLS